MKQLVYLLFGLNALSHWKADSSINEEESICIIENSGNSSTCSSRQNLQVIYPELGNAACIIIPKCHQFQKHLSEEWGEPSIKFPEAKEDMMHVLIMVDPDAPSRKNPKYRYWRHWLVTKVQGKDLLDGKVKGKVLSEYRPPTPPSGTGYHRYQFFLYEQPDEAIITLSEHETKSFGSWDLDLFISRFKLGKPVASTQFMTQNYKD
ncbi:phosphatidylethanolamine-binding protein 4 [Narcine bancroftii]|uniref:phosphatidylethanolamine-binding protein 4 n=1 Tax=Narcine bancroftii TaxID=1343680 RepID=UPI0038316EB1